MAPRFALRRHAPPRNPALAAPVCLHQSNDTCPRPAKRRLLRRSCAQASAAGGPGNAHTGAWACRLPDAAAAPAPRGTDPSTEQRQNRKKRACMAAEASPRCRQRHLQRRRRALSTHPSSAITRPCVCLRSTSVPAVQVPANASRWNHARHSWPFVDCVDLGTP